MSIGRVIENDLVRRDKHPFTVDEGIPTIFGMLSLAKFDLERGLDGVCGVATGLRISIPIGVLVIVRTLQIFQKCFVGSVRPLAFNRIIGIWIVWPTVK